MHMDLTQTIAPSDNQAFIRDDFFRKYGTQILKLIFFVLIWLGMTHMVHIYIIQYVQMYA